MLDEELVCKYCDAVLSELCKYIDTYTQKHVCYATGEYRGNTDLDVFATLGIPEEYVYTVVTILLDHKLIMLSLRQQTILNNEIYSRCSWIGINEAGRHFVKTDSFYLEWARRKSEDERSEANHRKTQQDLAIGDWLLKTKWLPHVFSIVGLLWGCYIFIDAKSDSKKQKQQIENLEQILQETKSEIYKRMDSLYQIRRNAKPERKK